MIKPSNITLLCVVFFISVFPVSLKSQDSSRSITLDHKPKLSGEVYNFSMRSTGEDYYLDGDWQRGDVLLVSDKKVRDKLIKYNTYLDELIWMSEESYKRVKVDKSLVKEFTIDLPDRAEPVVFKNIEMDKSSGSDKKSNYLEKLYKGDISLMAHRRVTIASERLVSSGGSLHSLPRLRSRPKFYIVKPGNQVYEVERFSRRALYRIFSDKRSEIRAAFRDERLRIRDENDLIRAVSLIDEIL